MCGLRMKEEQRYSGISTLGAKRVKITLTEKGKLDWGIEEEYPTTYVGFQQLLAIELVFRR